ncbi:MAG: hypothetical protein COB38_08750 [Gammaproteobacteria bacterium]|nr:MAG: hypothetical protein COB38_08750 [Gammaproteobacteria bacterium]
MKLTVGELREELSLYAEDTEISFSGLDFYRLTTRDDKLVQFEFNQGIYKDNITGDIKISCPEIE